VRPHRRVDPHDVGDAFFADRLRQASVERGLEIIGEALTRLRREFPEVAAGVPELREVVDFRNLLSHWYHAVGLRVVWSLAQHELPPLVVAVRKGLVGLYPQTRLYEGSAPSSTASRRSSPCAARTTPSKASRFPSRRAVQPLHRPPLRPSRLLERGPLRLRRAGLLAALDRAGDRARSPISVAPTVRGAHARRSPAPVRA